VHSSKCGFVTGPVRSGARTGWEGALDGSGLEACVCGAGAGKTS